MIQRPETVILVDYTPETADILQKMLEAENHNVEVCQSGEEALSKLRVHNPIALITSQRLHTETGVATNGGMDLIRRARSKSPDLPVMMVTGGRDEGPVAEINSMVKAILLHKPFTNAEFLHAFRSLVDQDRRQGGEETGMGSPS